jgi:hypothetical protein
MEVFAMTGRIRFRLLILTTTLCVLSGCSDEGKPPEAATPYVDQGYKPGVPAFMRGTVFERTDNGNTEPYPISGYSLVVNLHNTGDDSGIPTAVRDALIKHMALAGFGQHNDPRYTNLQPEQILRDKRVAIVRVIGMLPVGARRDQRFDIIVQSMPRSHTTSLAHGHLYNTELRARGLDLPAGGGTILAYADAGDVFVDPEFALEGATKPYPGKTAEEIQTDLCTGTVMNAGKITEDRPIFLQLRVPQASIARTIEARVITRFPTQENDRPAAAAQDEGLIELFVPYSFEGNWRHFLGVVNHLYLSDSPAFVMEKTRQLIDLATKPGAPLSDISFCLEGLGPTAVSLYEPLFTDPDPHVAFAAARAAVFCDDAGALEALTQMAGDGNNPCQLDAVRTIGELSASPAIDKRLEPLLASDNTTVRIEAYKILAAHNDRRILTEDIAGHFQLDLIDADGPPLIYAGRSGVARLAIFGRSPALAPPVVFAAMQNRLTISSDDTGQAVTLFYRPESQPKAVSVRSGPTLAEIAARLGGRGPIDEDRCNFSFADVVAVIQSLTDAKLVMGPDMSGRLAAAPFVLDQPADLTDALAMVVAQDRPQIAGRPQASSPQGTATARIPLAATPAPAGPAAPPAGASDSPSVPSFGN